MTYDIFNCDCRDGMQLLMAPASVQTVVTSPPYFGLRDYGVEGQLGLEPTPAEFVEALVDVFREVRRVLRDDGTVWLNLGDSWARDPRKGGSDPGGKNEMRWGYGAAQGAWRAPAPASPGLAGKQLVGIPWRVAFALQADGWFLRQDIIWNKPNAMPESVTDRCTKAHEYLFLLSKSPRYYFNSDAIKELAVGAGKDQRRLRRTDSGNESAVPGASEHSGLHRKGTEREPEYRNPRSVWSIATKPYAGAHFATFPPDLAERCILAGSKLGDLVLDPFGGSGTVAAVALKHGRRAALCELNPEYVDLAHARIAEAAQ